MSQFPEKGEKCQIKDKSRTEFIPEQITLIKNYPKKFRTEGLRYMYSKNSELLVMLMGFVVVAAVSETTFVNSLKQCWGERPLIFPLHNTTNLV